MSPTGPALICYDGSPSARRALTAAQKVVGDGPAVLLHVWSAPPEVLADSFSTRGGGAPTAALEAEALERAGAVTAEGVRLAKEAGLTVEVREARSTQAVWQTILEVADELDASLLVVGTHGVTAAADALLGSVSHGLLHHSERPVLVVPAGAQASS
ncbi:MAG TPA: universal stress protein [Solirubrobacteraceae bacterium]